MFDRCKMPQCTKKHKMTNGLFKLVRPRDCNCKLYCYYLWRQSMAAGDRGATGVSVTRPVEVDTRPELVNVLGLNTVACPAPVLQWSISSVTSSLAPVSIMQPSVRETSQEGKCSLHRYLLGIIEIPRYAAIGQKWGCSKRRTSRPFHQAYF